MSFSLDHVVIRVPEPDDLARQVSEATGLPVLRGWTPDAVRSRGVRFANGPFLDIHQAAEAQPAYLGLKGSVTEAARLATLHDWRVRPAEESGAFPWRILLFRRGQGALTALFVIDYAPPDHPLWATEEFSGELFRPSEGEGARLTRVTLAAPDGETAAGLGDLIGGGVEVRLGQVSEVVRLEAAIPGLTRLQRVELTPRLTLSLRPVI